MPANRNSSAGRAAAIMEKMVSEGQISLYPLYIKDGYIGIWPDKIENPIGDSSYALQLAADVEDNSGSAIANGWIAYSSIKHKENVEQLDHALEKVLQLRGVSFNWKKSKKEDVGLIAEEVAEVIPRVVQFDENDGTSAVGLDYTRLVPYLIECVKEQQNRILELENKVSEINKKNKDS